VALRDMTDREAVLRAMAEADKIGERAFLGKYGFGESRRYRIVHEGKSYPSKAILAAAHGYQLPDRGPLTPAEFSGGNQTITSPIERTDQLIMPDELEGQAAYPWKIRFEHLGTERNVALAPGARLSADASDGLRKSAINRGRGILVPIVGSPLLEGFMNYAPRTVDLAAADITLAASGLFPQWKKLACSCEKTTSKRFSRRS
jgi:hypothetical protein